MFTMPVTNPLLLAIDPVAVNLLSTYKPFLILLGVLPYAWVISSVIERDCRRRRLLPERWAALGLTVLVIGLASALLIPIFWVGWPLMLLMYCAVPYSYWKFRDQRVEASERFELFSEKFANFRESRRAKKAFGEVTASYSNTKGKVQTPPGKDTPNFDIHINTERLLVPSLPARASRVELTPVGPNYLTVQTVDSVKSRRETYPQAIGLQMINYLKTAAGIDVVERRKRQTGMLGMKIGDGEVKFQLTTWGTPAGQVLRLELDHEKQLSVPYDSLGILPIQTQTLKDAIDKVPGGVVLVLAPPGHGLTTLGYALLTQHNPYTSDIKTVERIIDRRLEGVTQAAWTAGESTMEYPTLLQSIVRRGPNVMLVSDIGDPGTGPVLVHSNSQATLFYVLLPTDSISVALAAYFKAVGDPKAAAGALRAVVTGRLVRKLCTNCRQPFQASADQAKRLGGAPGKPLQLFRASGKVQVKNNIVDCPECQATGFVGTVGVFEIVRPDDRAREFLIGGDIVNAYQQMRRAFKTPMVQECALLKARTGETSLEEIARVFAPKPAQAAAPATSAAKPTGNPSGTMPSAPPRAPTSTPTPAPTTSKPAAKESK